MSNNTTQTAYMGQQPKPEIFTPLEASVAIVIVNYKVPYLLEQCLRAVYVAKEAIAQCEIWVVDNDSQDGSIAYLRERFPEVNYIENKENVGFSKANNQAIKQTNSEFVLLLNPDTIITSQTLVRCVREMRQRPRCGAVSVCTYDIHGRYLPESKRGFPSPWVSFCRFTGLCYLFPKSKFFAKYYMGHLSEKEPQSVEVLIGAYMFMRRSVLDEVGLLDETFFMYGEDIDLSYRIYRAGYECRYLPSPIIHYKGESSVLDNERYIRSFYGAMKIFYAKYYPKRNILGRYIIGLGINVIATLARLRSCLRAKKKVVAPKPLVPLDLYATSDALPPKESHVVVDKELYSYDEIIDHIVKYGDRCYTYYIKYPDGRVIAPKG